VLDARSVFLCSRRCSWLRLFAVLPGSLWTVLSFFMLAFVLVVMFHFFSRYGDNYVLPRPPPTIPICYYHHSCHYHDYGNYYQVMFHAMPPLPQRDTLPPLLLLLYDYCYYYRPLLYYYHCFHSDNRPLLFACRSGSGGGQCSSSSGRGTSSRSR